jgi:hypothetical protein
MQIRASQFQKERGCMHPGCDGVLHGHGSYSRYSGPDGSECFAVPRYCCSRCRLTLSVLADERMSYRAVTVAEVEAAFDRTVGRGEAEDAARASPAASEKKSGCLDRAWKAWNRNSRRIAELMGHLLPREALGCAQRCWRSLRAAFSLEGILKLLGERFKTSLLGDYRCLKPRAPRAVGS